MSYLVVLVPIALLLGLGGLATFLWSLWAGQYDDLDGAARAAGSGGASTDASVDAPGPTEAASQPG